MSLIQDFQTVNAEFPWFFQVMIFIFGAIVGSFLNVCIYRIPAKKSIVHPGSTCSCGKKIAAYDNIPILSWFILRGRARCCKQPYSIRYPMVEALTGALFLFAWIELPAAKAACIMFFISLMVCASFIDWDTMEIPDRFSIGTAFFGILLSAFIPALHGHSVEPFSVACIRSFTDAITGLFIGSGLILWLALTAEVILRKEAMGFGDVKLLGAIGAFAGWQGAVFALFGGAAIGTIALMVYLPFKLLLKKKPKTEENENKIVGVRTPFGPMLAAGALVYLLFLETEVDKYFELVAELLT
tara:strand:- start:1482 stop:2378 length:897 start_codon:yes stop_codon:yes gene_type:complete